MKDLYFTRFIEEAHMDHDFDSKFPLCISFTTFWVFVMSVAGLYQVFSVFFWVSVPGFPNGINLSLEILIEGLYILDLIVRLSLHRFPSHDHRLRALNLYFSSENGGGLTAKEVLRDCLIIIGGLPIATCITIANHFTFLDINNNDLYSYLLFFKLGRFFDLTQTRDKIKAILNNLPFAFVIFFKLFLALVILLLTTHIAGCFWLLINKAEASEFTYYQSNRQKHNNLSDQYILALEWAVSSMTGSCFGDVVPMTNIEVLASVIIMVIGSTFYGQIFADFESIIYVSRMEKLEKKKRFDQTKELCILRKIPESIKVRIKKFYLDNKGEYNKENYYPLIKSLPESLHTELSLLLNQDMIRRARFFYLGSPAFVVEVCRHLYPKICQTADTIIRVGEIADKFYFIKKGRVEILCHDNRTTIAILETGAYFGEIGLLVTAKRTATVRALAPCHFEVLDKEHFDEIMASFPDQRDYLLKVGNQRMKTTNPEDLERDAFEDGEEEKANNGVNERNVHFSNDTDNGNGINGINGIMRGRFISSGTSKELNSTRLTLIHSADSGMFLIQPNSRFYVFWVFLLCFFVGYDLIIVPFSICFSPEFSIEILIIDLVRIFVLFLDIFFQLNSAFEINGQLIADRNVIRYHYLTTEFIFDFISFISLDVVGLLIISNNKIVDWLKVLRFLKLVRVYNSLNFINTNAEKRIPFYSLFRLVIIHLFVSHYCACVMYAIAYYEIGHNPDRNMINTIDLLTIPRERPFLEKNSLEQYLNFLYWMYSLSTTGPYGDILAITKLEKIFEILCMVAFKLFNAFMVAEVSNLSTTTELAYSEYLAKIEKTKSWMEHLKLPKEYSERVLKFYECGWKKFRGIHENEIINHLPETIKDDFLIFLLQDVVEKVNYFPKNDSGAILSIIKRLKIFLLPKDEYIFKGGELASEMYFIIEGEAGVMAEDEVTTIAILKKSNYFGEMGIINGKKSVKALTELSLAVFSLEDFNFISSHYPNCVQIMRKNSLILKHINESLDDPRLRTRAKTMSHDHSKVKENRHHSLNQTHEKDNPSISVKTNPISPQMSVLEESSSQGSNQQIESFGKMHVESFKRNPKAQSFALNSIKKLTTNSKIPKTSLLIPYNNAETLPLSQDLKRNKSFDHCLMSEADEKAGNNKQETVTEDIANTENPEIKTDSQEKDQDKDTERPLITENDKRASWKVTENPWKQEEIPNLQPPPNPKESDLAPKPNPIVLNSINEESINSASLPIKTSRCYKLLLALKPFWQKLENKFLLKAFYLNLLLFIASGYSCVYYPLYLAYPELGFEGGLLFMEILSLLAYVWSLWVEARHDWNRYLRSKSGFKILDVILALGYRILLVIPFCLTFEAQEIEPRRRNVGLLFLQLIRLTNFNHRLWVLKFIKQKIPSLGKFLGVILIYLDISHLFACLFIVFGRLNANFNYSWFSKVPAPQVTFPNNYRSNLTISDQSLYIHALYWSYVTSSHVGIGDVNPVTWEEKLFCTLVMIITTFTYIAFFGNMASLFQDLVPVLKSQLEKSSSLVLTYCKDMKLEAYQNIVDSYFQHSWNKSKGTNENELLAGLPSRLRIDIQTWRYQAVIYKSGFFVDPISGRHSPTLTSSIIRFLSYEIVMSEEIVIVAGQVCNDIFILLEGEVEMINFDLRRMKTLHPGDYFGGIESDTRQFAHYETKDICNFAVLKLEYYRQLQDGFKDWAEALRTKHLLNKTEALIGLEYFDQKKDNTMFESLRMPDMPLEVNDPLLAFYENFVNIYRRNHSPIKSFSEASFSSNNFNGPKLQKHKTLNFLSSIKSNTSTFLQMLSNRKSLRKLFAVSEAFQNPNSRLFIRLVILKTLMVVYSLFALPLYVAYDIPATTPIIIILEVLVSVVSGLHIYLKAKSFRKKSHGTDTKHLLMQFIFKTDFLFDLIGFIPLYLLFSLDHKADDAISVSDLFKLLRIIQVLHFASLMRTLQYEYRSLYTLLSVFKSLVYLVMVIHWTACLWFFIDYKSHFNFPEHNWYSTGNNLENEEVYMKYLYSVFFVLNIATTTGFPQQIVYNDLERVCFIGVVYIGDAIFSIAFGMMASNSDVVFDKFPQNTENRIKIESLLDPGPGNNNYEPVKKKLKKYFNYLIELKSHNLSYLDTLRLLIPQQLFSDIVLSQTQKMLFKVPQFKEISLKPLLQEIALSLKQMIYLPNDSIINKWEVSEDIFLIIRGKVKVLPLNTDRIIQTICEGNYFSSQLIFQHYTTASIVVADSCCQIYVLARKDMKRIVKKYPLFEKKSMLKKLDSSFYEIPATSQNTSRLSPNRGKKTEVFRMRSFQVNSKEAGQVLLNLGQDDEYVNGDEMDFELKRRKQCRRWRCKNNRERRYSRINHGDNFLMSKFSGLRLQWGLNNADLP